MAMYFSNPYERWLSQRRMMNRWMNETPDEEYRGRVFFPMDIKVDDEAYTISALLPGVASEDLNITFVNDTLNIQGELKNKYDENATYILQERPYGQFYRSISLPESVDAAKVEASLTNGVLTLRVPKAEKAKPKTIKVLSK